MHPVVGSPTFVSSGTNSKPAPLNQPKSLKDLAQAKIPVTGTCRPLKGSGVPIAITRRGNNRLVNTLMGMPLLKAYMTLPVVCEHYRNEKIDNPRIAIVPFYLDQLGDIRIVLDLRLLIVAKFGVEPLIIADKNHQTRTLDFLKNSEESNGLKFIDLETVDPKDCKDLDLIIHGPAVDSTESQDPKKILLRYPRLKKALDTTHPPKIFSLLESESSFFTYSACVDEGRAAEKMLTIANVVFPGLLTDLANRTLDIKNHSYFNSMVVLYSAAEKYLDKPEQAAMSDLFRRICSVYQLILSNPYSINTLYQVARVGEDLKKFAASANQDIMFRTLTAPRFENVTNQVFADFFSLNYASCVDASNISVLQLGLNPIFSLGCFKLSKFLLKWKDSGLIDSAAGRKSILETFEEPVTSEERNLLDTLKAKNAFAFGYAHDDNIKKEFVEHAFRLNPELRDVVINMGFAEARKAFPKYNIIHHQFESTYNLYCYPPQSTHDRFSKFTVHLYNKVNPHVFDALTAASDQGCRLAGGDNTLFTALMLGTDDLIYEMRGFKRGIFLALFKLADELSAEEKNCIVDRMLSSADDNLIKSFASIVPEEFAGYVDRNSKRTLSEPGTPVYTQAFRKMGDIIRARASIFEETLTGFIKLQIMKRRMKAEG